MRHNLSVCFRLLLFTLSSLAIALASAAGCEKKGVGSNYIPGVKQRVVLAELHAHWYYDWIPYPIKDKIDIPYVPMFSGAHHRFQGDLDNLPNFGVIPIMLTFNEPDLKESDALTTPDEATQVWPLLAAHATRIGSPSASVYHPQWLTQFMSEAKQKGLRVDFIAFHYYGAPDPKLFLMRIDDLHNRYNLPIWVTEFAVLNDQWRTNPDLYTESDALKFMRAVLPELERRSYVERFAWWGIGGVNPIRLRMSRFFNDDGTLTSVGQYYADFEANEHDAVCGDPH